MRSRGVSLFGRRGRVGSKHQASAGVGSLRALVAAVTVGTLVLGGWPTRTFAQEPPAVVDQEALSDHLFAAQLQIRDGGLGGLAHLVLSAELLEWRRQNPSASPQEVADSFAARQQALDSGLTAQDRELPEPDFAIRVVTVLLAAPPSSVATAEHVRALLDATLGRSLAAFDTRENLVNGSVHTAQWLRGRGDVEPGIWGSVRRTAVADGGFAHAWNAVIGLPLGLDATASFDQLKGDETLRTYIDVDAILARQGSRADFLAEARRQYGLVIGRLLEESRQARSRLAQLSATCPARADVSCTPEQRAAATQTAKTEQKQIDAGAAAAKVLGAIVGATDAKAGEKMQKVAAALFSIVTAINSYATAVAGRSALDAIFSASTLGLTGNIFGAIITLVGLFGESGPSLDQQILDQVVALRTEVRALHSEMRQSFQRIEAQLNVIFDNMMTEFAKLNLVVAGNNAALIEIQNVLAQQGLRLEKIAATILTAIGDVELHDARVDVDKYIGYAENYPGGAPLTFGEYTDPESEFHYVATEASSHTAFVVAPSEADDTTVDPATTLNSHGEAKAISYLARLAHFRDASVPDPADVIANPGVWNFAAQAYTLLQLQNPELAAGVASFRSDQIAVEGQRIIETARSFSQPAAAPDATGNRTNAVFASLLAEYRAALAALANQLGGVRTQQIVVRDGPGGIVPDPRYYDLFGAANQAIPEATLPSDPANLTPCNPGELGPSISRPSNVNFRSLAAELRFAHYAFSPTLDETSRLPELSQCYQVAWTSVREVFTSTSIDEYARLRLAVQTRFRWEPAPPNQGWRNARTVAYTWPEARISRQCISYRCTGEFYTTESQGLTARWPRDKGIFQQSATVTVDNALTSEARTTMTAFLQGRQRALYDRVATGIRDATPLKEAVDGMNKAARQLQAYTRLGFPIALAADDILSSLLFGRYQIPVNVSVTGDVQLDTTYNVAFNTYDCNPQVPIGTACFGSFFYPLRNQPHLETLGGTTVTQPVVCGISMAGVTGLPGDAVGDCLIASATRRLDALAARYRHHSQLLADGVYVEQLPWVSSTLATLPVVNTLVRTPPSN